jgi:hypothetical protein
MQADTEISALFTIGLPREGGVFNTGAGLVPAPATGTLSGGIDVVQASALVAFTGANNDLVFTVKLNATIGTTTLIGPAGNGIAIQFLNSGSNNPANNSVTWNPTTKIITIKIASNTTATAVRRW